jgi:flagellar basal-body rod modification protein FlgD
MAAMAGILNHATTPGQALSGASASPLANPAAAPNGTSSSNSTSSSSAAISANDFLTLLVTEMQNQDPTADVDPNEYINQLVQVNSLEQLIDINQTLAEATSAPPTTSTTPGSASSTSTAAGVTGTPSPAGATAQAPLSAHRTGVLSAAHSAVSGMMGNAASAQGVQLKHTSGNLGVPGANPSAQRVGHALDGKSHRRWVGGAQPGV